MSAIIKFPKIIKLDPKRFHRQRLFYIGKVLKGPPTLVTIKNTISEEMKKLGVTKNGL